MRDDVEDASNEHNTIVVEDDLLKQGFTQVPNALLRWPGVTHGAKLTYALLVTVHGVSNQAARGTARAGGGRREGLG